MSLSESEKELLLSASIDGALSDDERETLDRWLKVDPAAVKRLEEMESLRRDLRESLGQLRSSGSTRLGSAFADAVVNTAIAQAKADRLPNNHPLLRIDGAGHRNAAAVSPPTHVSPVVVSSNVVSSKAVSPAAGSSANGTGLSWTRTATVAALAASLLVAVVLYRNSDNRQVADRGEDKSVATGISTDGVVAKEEEGQAAISAATDGPGLSYDGLGGEAFNDSQVAAKSAEPMLAEPMSPDALAADDAAAQDSLAANDASAMRRSTGDASASAMRSGSSDAAAAAVMATDPDALAPPTADGAMMLSVVMVVSVELTPAGRQSLALLQALRESDIRMGADGLLSDQVLDGLRTDGAVDFGDAAEVAGESSRLYFVEAPAKQIDQFLMRLMADADSFASIGLSITDEPAVMASISGWATVESDDSSAVARDLVVADGNRVAFKQGDAIMPLPRDDAGAETLEMLTPPDFGDAKSQLLLLVK